MQIRYILTLFLLACIIFQVESKKSNKKLKKKKNDTAKYCKTKLCGLHNLACKYNGTPIKCQNVTLWNITKFINNITNDLNKIRNDVALGTVGDLPLAARMGAMVWSEELAYFAKLLVSQCNKLTGDCLSSPTFYYIGHLFYVKKRARSSSRIPISEVMRDGIDYWTDGISGIKRIHILHLPSSFTSPQQFSASLLINERNTRFGCALLVFRKHPNYSYQYLFICAFAVNNLSRQPIYKWAFKAGSGCKKKDKKYTGLCSIRENYKHNMEIFGEKNGLKDLTDIGIEKDEWNS